MWPTHFFRSCCLKWLTLLWLHTFPQGGEGPCGNCARHADENFFQLFWTGLKEVPSQFQAARAESLGTAQCWVVTIKAETVSKTEIRPNNGTFGTGAIISSAPGIYAKFHENNISAVSCDNRTLKCIVLNVEIIPPAMRKCSSVRIRAALFWIFRHAGGSPKASHVSFVHTDISNYYLAH